MTASLTTPWRKLIWAACLCNRIFILSWWTLAHRWSLYCTQTNTLRTLTMTPYLHLQNTRTATSLLMTRPWFVVSYPLHPAITCEQDSQIPPTRTMLPLSSKEPWSCSDLKELTLFFVTSNSSANCHITCWRSGPEDPNRTTSWEKAKVTPWDDQTWDPPLNDCALRFCQWTPQTGLETKGSSLRW